MQTLINWSNMYFFRNKSEPDRSFLRPGDPVQGDNEQLKQREVVFGSFQVCQRLDLDLYTEGIKRKSDWDRQVRVLVCVSDSYRVV